ncbi:MAG: hypothetical protein WCW40_04340, partial [Bacteroidota bacterium]
MRTNKPHQFLYYICIILVFSAALVYPQGQSIELTPLFSEHTRGNASVINFKPIKRPTICLVLSGG